MTYKEALIAISKSNPNPTSDNVNVNVVSSIPNIPTVVETAPLEVSTEAEVHPSAPKRASARMQGSVLRVSIPAGTGINFLNIVEFSSPDEINLVGKLPILGGLKAADRSLNSAISGWMNAIKALGGTIEILN